MRRSGSFQSASMGKVPFHGDGFTRRGQGERLIGQHVHDHVGLVVKAFLADEEQHLVVGTADGQVDVDLGRDRGRRRRLV